MCQRRHGIARGSQRPREVFHDFDPEDGCRADGDVGSSGKIAIELISKQQTCDEEDRAAVLSGFAEHGADNAADGVRNHQLLEASPQNAEHAAGHAVVVKRDLALELRQKIARALDRTRDDAREETHEQRIVQRVALGARFAAVHVDDVPERRKREVT